MKYVIGFSAGFLTPYHVSKFDQAGSTVTGEVSGQVIQLQNTHLIKGAWITGRVLRVVIQCAGIGALVFYL
jgi:hypothetical protein